MKVGIYSWISDNKPASTVWLSIKQTQLVHFQTDACREIIIVCNYNKLYKASPELQPSELQEVLKEAPNVSEGEFKIIDISKDTNNKSAKHTHT